MEISTEIVVVVLCALGQAPCSPPQMLAGPEQRRYGNRAGQRLHAQLMCLKGLRAPHRCCAGAQNNDDLLGLLPRWTVLTEVRKSTIKKLKRCLPNVSEVPGANIPVTCARTCANRSKTMGSWCAFQQPLGPCALSSPALCELSTQPWYSHVYCVCRSLNLHQSPALDATDPPRCPQFSRGITSDRCWG